MVSVFPFPVFCLRFFQETILSRLGESKFFGKICIFEFFLRNFTIFLMNFFHLKKFKKNIKKRKILRDKNLRFMDFQRYIHRYIHLRNLFSKKVKQSLNFGTDYFSQNTH